MYSKVFRWLLRSICGCLFLLLVAAAALLAINWRDERLLPAAAAITDGKTAAAAAPDQNLFFTFIGLSSNEGEQPNAEGQRVFALYRQALGPSWGDLSLFMEGGPRSDIYATTKVRAFRYGAELTQLCGPNPADGVFRCIADARSRRAQWEKILADNRGLLDRYRQIGGQPQYLNVLAPLPAISVTSYYTLTTAHRLQITAWALQLDGDQQDDVIAALVADLKFWRAFLALRNPPLIEKSIAVSLVRGDLELISELLRTHQLTPPQYRNLDESLGPFTVAERSVAGAVDAELRWSTKVLSEEWLVGGRPYRICDFSSAGHRVLDALSCAGFEPNATINRIYRNYHELALLSEQSCERYDSGHAIAEEHQRRAPMDYLYNPTGAWRASGASPLDNLVAKLCNLEGMRRIVALQLAIRRNQLADRQIQAFVEQAGADYMDPFTGKPMQWDAQDRTLAFRPRPLPGGGLVRWPIGPSSPS